MSKVRYKQLEQISFTDLEVYSALPEHPIWSRVAEQIDFSFADELCAPLYSTRGPRPYAPSLKLKLHLVQRYYNLSDRQMEERVIGDLFIKRFLGLPVTFMGMDHSTLGLDRERMGSALFDACHHHILAQAKQKGLWGNEADVWLVDSFHTNGHVPRRSAYRLIQHAILRVVNQLKRAHPALYRQLCRQWDAEPVLTRFASEASPEERALTFSTLVLSGHRLLRWFEQEDVNRLFWSWPDSKRQRASLERQAILYQILAENTEPEDPNDPESPRKKKPFKARPASRIMSSVDTDARLSRKNGRSYLGDKNQVLTSAKHNLVLVSEPIDGNEPDGALFPSLVQTAMDRHDVKPKALVGDSAYGHGRQRQAFAQRELRLVAPVKLVGENPTGLFSNVRFRYDAAAGSMTCPADVVTKRGYHSRQQEGKQYHFPKERCFSCSLRAQCTDSNEGRKVFVSDYYDDFQAAKAFNQTEEGRGLLRLRYRVERKIHELKNHQGLGEARTTTREKRRTYVKLASMVVNMKVFVKQVGSLQLSFDRKRRTYFTLLGNPRLA